MADPASANFNACCRLCLLATDNLKSVFDGGEALQQKVLTAVEVEIRTNDKLSTKVCKFCIEKVESWFVYKQHCTENQKKLDQWLQTSNNPDLSIQIKEEPIDDVTEDISLADISLDADVLVKNETIHDTADDLPPPLTPQTVENVEVEVDVESTEPQTREPIYDPKKCSVCGKILSSMSNRKKHERNIHGINPHNKSTVEVSAGEDESFQHSINNQSVANLNDSRTDADKLAFASGLKLSWHNPSLQTPSLNGLPPTKSLTDIEKSYIEKWKSIVTMYNSLKCICHNTVYPTLKRMIDHIRPLNLWLRTYTCCHCMIVFANRSSTGKHHSRCDRTNLENLVKLSNLEARSAMKKRLYQNYRCSQCHFIFSFHEDFCRHVDEVHTNINLPHKCTCGKFFTTLSDYKNHVYQKCLMEFYCDVCHATETSMEAFERHATEVHDKSPGTVVFDAASYKRTQVDNTTVAKTLRRECADVSNIITGKRRSSFYNRLPLIEPELDEYDMEESKKVVNPVQRIPGTTCPICMKEFATNKSMWRHYKNHMQDTNWNASKQNNPIYCCPDCGGVYSAIEWEQHKQSHPKKSCDICAKEFHFQTELDKHQTMHSKSKTPKNGGTTLKMCNICDKSFTSKKLLDEHLLVHETMPVLESALVIDEEKKLKKFQCNMCDKQYVYRGGLWDHKRKKHPNGLRHSEIAPYSCQYCSKVFATESAYTMHQQTHQKANKTLPIIQIDHDDDYEEGESYFNCKQCFKVFENRSRLNKHMKSHSAKKLPKKIQCEVCHLTFDNEMELHRHKNTKQCIAQLTPDKNSSTPLKKIFPCPYCVQTFNSRSSLFRHKQKEHAKELHKKDHTPQQQEKSEKQTLNYIREPQVQIVEEPITSYKCNRCNAVLPNDTALQVHILEKHLNVNTFVSAGRCVKCNLDFHTKKEYENHCQLHIETTPKVVVVNPVKKFPCDYCPSGYSRMAKLKEHLQKVHPEHVVIPTEYECQQCGRIFDKQVSLTIHLKVHEKQKTHGNKANFSCSICSKVFQLPNELRAHTIQAHPF